MDSLLLPFCLISYVIIFPATGGLVLAESRSISHPRLDSVGAVPPPPLAVYAASNPDQPSTCNHSKSMRFILRNP